MTNKDVIDGWRRIILGDKDVEIIDCKECHGSGFSSQGTGYDSVCDNCGGKGELPK